MEKMGSGQVEKPAPIKAGFLLNYDLIPSTEPSR
jgi:hypothetical protein